MMRPRSIRSSCVIANILLDVGQTVHRPARAVTVAVFKKEGPASLLEVSLGADAAEPAAKKRKVLGDGLSTTEPENFVSLTTAEKETLRRMQDQGSGDFLGELFRQEPSYAQLLRDNVSFFKRAVRLDGRSLRFASAKVRATPEVVVAAVQQNPAAFEYLDESAWRAEGKKGGGPLKQIVQSEHFQQEALRYIPAEAAKDWHFMQALVEAEYSLATDEKLLFAYWDNEEVRRELLTIVLLNDKHLALSEAEQRNALVRIAKNVADKVDDADAELSGLTETFQADFLYIEKELEGLEDDALRKKVHDNGVFLTTRFVKKDAGRKDRSFKNFLHTHPEEAQKKIPELPIVKDALERYLPVPAPHLIGTWKGKKAFVALVEKVQANTRFKSYRGPAPSRLERGKFVGSAEYEDEKNGIAWPDGYAEHYIGKHNVPPTLRFLQYIRYRAEKLGLANRDFVDPPVVMPDSVFPDHEGYFDELSPYEYANLPVF
eukprot:g15101.t1